MCGIVGYINTNSELIKDTSRILSMLEAQRHRGPDDSGVRAFSLQSCKSLELNNKVPASIDGDFEGVLGFNRLSILDLSANGHQPMVSSDGSVILAFNGEIYNAFDFKEELETWGYKFKSSSDTEVILALYLKYGFDEMILKLNGMFAIVIADFRMQQMFVARDRFGIKPMYFISNSNVFAFSSELKCFKYLNNFSFQLNRNKLDEYLLFRNNLNDTLFDGIKALKPGHYISYNKNNGIIVKRFFDINAYSRNVTEGVNIETVGKSLEDWLGKSVKSQLMSDVKLGCQLSGGIDSSLVTWLANRNCTDGNFESVSIVFDNERFSEEKYIDVVRDRLGIQAHKFILDSDYYLDNFEKATWHLEVPLNHPNTIGIYKLSQRAKDYVTVLLSGEGADEVFGGYSWFYDACFPYRKRKLLSIVNKNLSSPKDIFKYFQADLRSVMGTAYVTPELASKLNPAFNFKNATTERRLLYNNLEGSVFDRQVKYEFQTYLPDLLIRQDKMSMAHSIENRVPFLDNELVKNSFNIPEKYLMIKRNGNINSEKYLLKKLSEGVFGKEFTYRNKMGFGIPLRDFFNNNRFKEYLNDKILLGIKNRGVFDYNMVSKWLQNVNGLKYTELEALWVAISFEIWSSIFFSKQ
ncbi:MAG: asparagine synthase (glutamine-hydrolyzing) [Marinilabiliaceae bacterium]|nr:asparagine synthase (glutamine-hydrolyzing) [Marinilabiliaceae bacterium]